MIDVVAAEAEVVRMWHAAARHHTAGYMSKAVAGWAEAMDYQRQKAIEAGYQMHTRYMLSAGWTVGLGHIAAFDIFCKAKILGMSDTNRVVVADREITKEPFTQGIINNTYVDLFRPYMTVVPQTGFIEDVRLIQDYLAVVDVTGKWEWFLDAQVIVENKWQEAGHSPLIKLSLEQVAEGRQKLNLKPDDWFVTLHTRKLGDFQNLRDIDPTAYAPSLQRIGKAGGQVFQVPSGDTFMDIFLLSEAKFAIVGNSGPAWAAGTLGTPCLLANWVPVGVKFPYKGALMIPKRLFSTTRNTHLTAEEMFNEPFNHIVAETVLAEHGVVAIPNTTDELMGGVEMMLKQVGIA